jgi:hypothetical protein
VNTDGLSTTDRAALAAGTTRYTDGGTPTAPVRTNRLEVMGGYTSPAAQRWDEAKQRAAADAARDTYQVPETREQLLAMKTVDQVRTYEQHREVYDRLMGHG